MDQFLEKHMREDERVFAHIDETITKIKDNHLAHIQESMSELRTDLVELKIDTMWLKKFFWVIATASIGSLVSGILGLLIKRV